MKGGQSQTGGAAYLPIVRSGAATGDREKGRHKDGTKKRVNTGSGRGDNVGRGRKAERKGANKKDEISGTGKGGESCRE